MRKARPLYHHRMAILHVDDHESLRDLVRHALAVHGFEVVSADGVAAAKRAVARRDDISGALLDLELRDGSGIDLYDWLAASRPALATRVAFVTGAGRSLPSMRLAATGLPILEKPFELADIVRLASAWEGASAGGHNGADHPDRADGARGGEARRAGQFGDRDHDLRP